jgi:hypothetical protein
MTQEQQSIHSLFAACASSAHFLGDRATVGKAYRFMGLLDGSRSADDPFADIMDIFDGMVRRQ